jgi:hypothetical protein
MKVTKKTEKTLARLTEIERMLSSTKPMYDDMAKSVGDALTMERNTLRATVVSEMLPFVTSLIQAGLLGIVGVNSDATSAEWVPRSMSSRDGS